MTFYLDNFQPYEKDKKVYIKTAGFFSPDTIIEITRMRMEKVSKIEFTIHYT